MIHSRSADDLERNWHGAIVKPGRKRDGGKAEKVGKASPSAELVECFRFEAGLAGIAFRHGRCSHRQNGHDDGLSIFKHASDKIVCKLPSRQNICSQRFFIDLKSLAQALRQRDVE